MCVVRNKMNMSFANVTEIITAMKRRQLYATTNGHEQRQSKYTRSSIWIVVVMRIKYRMRRYKSFLCSFKIRISTMEAKQITNESDKIVPEEIGSSFSSY